MGMRGRAAGEHVQSSERANVDSGHETKGQEDQGHAACMRMTDQVSDNDAGSEASLDW